MLSRRPKQTEIPRCISVWAISVTSLLFTLLMLRPVPHHGDAVVEASDSKAAGRDGECAFAYVPHFAFHLQVSDWTKQLYRQVLASPQSRLSAGDEHCADAGDALATHVHTHRMDVKKDEMDRHRRHRATLAAQ